MTDAIAGEVVGPTTVYRLYDADGVLLYVGCTGSIAARLSAHREKPWWPQVQSTRYEHFDTRQEALAAELRAIRTEAPVFNVKDVPGRGDQAASTDAGRVRFMARLEPELHAALADAADELDWSTNSALNEAVRRFIERRQADTARLDSPDHPDYDTVELRPTKEPGAYRVVVEGYPVPHLTAHSADPPEGTSLTGHDALGWHTLTLDDRFATKAMRWGELWPMCWFMAQAMAVAAGYSSHGPNATRLNPHGPNEDAVDFAAWAERGWVLADARGSNGFTYELNFTFRLPAIDGADLQVHALREELVALISTNGGRDVCTRTVSLRPLQAEPSAVPLIVRGPADQIDQIAERRVEPPL